MLTSAPGLYAYWNGTLRSGAHLATDAAKPSKWFQIGPHAAWVDEVAHILEDRLHQDVLDAIAAGKCADPAAGAITNLTLAVALREGWALLATV